MIHDKNNILYMSSQELAAEIKNAKISCYQVITIFITHIQKYNPEINALAYECFKDSLEIARFYDRKYKNYKKNNKINLLPKYFGVPVIIKESFEMLNKPFTFGYIFRKDIVGKKNNEHCQKLINNGFIILAAGNLAEGCSWIESYNPIYGKTNNPYDLLRTSGGSSGGTAALITILASPFGLCNDALGSIRIPAYYNCLFGHKPTGGCIKGCYSDISDMDSFEEIAQSGIVSRKSEELWPIIRLLSDTDKIETNKYDNLKLEDITFIYIGDSFKNIFTTELDSSLDNCIKNCFNFLKTKNCKIKKVLINEFELSILLVLNTLSKCDNTDSDNIYINQNSFYQNFKQLSFVNFGLSIINKLSHKYKTNNKENIADNINKILNKKIELLLKKKNTILVCPTMPILAPYHDTSVKYLFDLAMVGIFNILKLPVTQVPLGLNFEGIPLGIQIIGNQYDDKLTIKTAELLEKEGIAKWVPPNFIN